MSDTGPKTILRIQSNTPNYIRGRGVLRGKIRKKDYPKMKSILKWINI